MTIIVAVKVDGKVAIGADSLITLEDQKLVKDINNSKLVNFGNFVVGFAGIGPIDDCLETLYEDKGKEFWSKYVIDKKSHARDFYEEMSSYFLEKDTEENLETVGLIIATTTKIFYTAAPSSISEVGDFWAMGSGSSYSIGALEILFPQMIQGKLTIRQGLRKALMTACKYSTTCQAPIEIILLE